MLSFPTLFSFFKHFFDDYNDYWGFRYHGDWRSETQTAVSLIGFLHWLETGNLLMHSEAEEKLGCKDSFPSAISCSIKLKPASYLGLISTFIDN